MLRATGLPIPDGSRLLDTMLAARVLEAGDGDFKRRGRFTLAEVAKRYVGVELDKAEQASDWSGGLSDAQLAYAARDAAILPTLAERLHRAAGLARLADTIAPEMGALPALVWLEGAGAPFDAGGWATLAEAAVRRQVEAARRLDAIVGPADLFGGSGVNWDSTAQVKKALHARGHALERVDEATLAALAADDALAAAMLDYREATKRAGTYGIEFLAHVHDATGRIHADYQQLGAESGRMSCSRPNLQQVPRDPAYRACFRPPEGRVLVKADYSQIELRIAAELALDERLIAAYANGEDMHAITAATVLGCGDGPVTKEDRQAAKALNFGLLYGMGAPTLRAYARNNYGVTLSEREAAEFRTRFFRTYAGLARWHASRPRATVETRTVGGRRRLAVSQFTQKCNTPVQGTGADGLKAALALLWETRDRCPTAAPVLCVHDEVVVEVDADEAEQAREWLVDCMTRGMQRFLRRVPVVVDATIARDWAGTPLADEEGRAVA
jgi:DNA polymerase-1